MYLEKQLHIQIFQPLSDESQYAYSIFLWNLN